MYYVVKKDDDLSNYHYVFVGELALNKAKESACNLKAFLMHDYEVIKVETVWTTETLEEEMKG